jgi:FKBP-type peptidyl-prolyl cis-trans isomerase FkpA/FKBP-type peptidyl-prolyl cis-trans isomerase FklB
MPWKLVLVAGIGMTACDRKAAKIETDMQKASYGIGTQIGKNMKQNSIDIDSAALALGLNDALEGKEFKLKPEEMQAAQTKLQETAMKKKTESGEKNKVDGAAFLEKNKAVAGVVTTATGLQYQVVTEGTGPIPADTDVVTAHYEGKLLSGEKFDSSYDRKEPADFPVTGVIPGWTEALKLMKVGSKWKLFVPSDLAYGPSGRPGIPPNAVLIFDVELLGIKSAAPAVAPAAPAVESAPPTGAAVPAEAEKPKDKI